MKRHLLHTIIVMLFLACPSFAQEPPIKAGDPLDLDRAIEIGLKMNPAITGYHYAMKAREAQVGQARAGFFPSIDGNASFTRNF